MKKILVALAMTLLISLLVIASASAQSNHPGPVIEAPLLVKGESWTMASGAKETFLREEGAALVFYREDHKFTGERYRTKELNLMYDIKDGAQINIRRPHFGLTSFPLYIGKSWGMTYQNKGTWRTNRYEVTAFEKVTIGEETLDAFRIEGTDKKDGNSHGIKVVAWYSPSAKTIVKMTGEDESNHMGVTGWNYEVWAHEIPH